MRRLSLQQLEDAFLSADINRFWLGTFWVILNHAKHERGIDLCEALQRIRMQAFDVAVFVEKILQQEDLDDVVHVIEMLQAENPPGNPYLPASLGLLQAWRARTLMQIVIYKRNAAHQGQRNTAAGQTCD